MQALISFWAYPPLLYSSPVAETAGQSAHSGHGKSGSENHAARCGSRAADAIIATGRCDFPNQVNNFLCFPYILCFALDCHATEVNEDVKMAAVSAIAALARVQPVKPWPMPMEGELLFGPEHMIPKPFDPCLIRDIAPAVAKAAADTGDAPEPITDVPAYRSRSVRYELDRLNLRDWTPVGVDKVSSSRGLPHWMSFLSDRT